MLLCTYSCSSNPPTCIVLYTVPLSGFALGSPEFNYLTTGQPPFFWEYIFIFVYSVPNRPCSIYIYQYPNKAFMLSGFFCAKIPKRDLDTKLENTTKIVLSFP